MAIETYNPSANGNGTKPPRLRAGELAWSGGEAMFGKVDPGEYNPDLKGRLAVQTADKMRRSDAQVRAVEKIISLPIRGTAWLIEEPDDASASEKEAAELLRENLFGGMEQSWDDLLREACLAMYLGFRIPEIVWEERQGVLAVKKVASRNPQLLEQWLYRGSDLVGYLYVGNRPNGKGLEDFPVSNNEYERVPVPIEKTLHFCYDQENENPFGFGLWRSMYPHWYYKQALYKIMGVGIERNYLGTPVAEEPEGAQEDDRTAMKQQLSWLRAAENAAFVLPQGWKLSWFETTRDLTDAMPLVSHHDFKIMQAGLCQFMTMGQAAVGTQALGDTQQDIFYLAEDGACAWIEQTIEKQLIDPWCLYNYGPGVRCPALTHRKIAARNSLTFAQALNAYVTAGALHMTPDDEEFIRDIFEFPQIPKEQLVQLEEERKAQQEEERQANIDVMKSKAAQPQAGEMPNPPLKKAA